MKPADKKHALWALVVVLVTYLVCKSWVTPKRHLEINLCTNEVPTQWMQ